MRGRILLASAAVVLVAITALELRAELDYQEGQELLIREIAEAGSSADAAAGLGRARDNLERASPFRPGTTALVARVFLEKTAGELSEAEALARKATEREPDNVATWHALLTASRDPDERARAAEELRRLDPYRSER